MKHKAAKRYAKALFDLSEDHSKLKKIHDDISTIGQLCQSSEDLRFFITNPTISTKRQKEVLEALFKKKADPITFNFLLFLTDKEILHLLEKICEHFEKMYLDHIQVFKVKIISVCKMQREQISAICEKLKKYFKRDIEAQLIVDGNMLGGFKIEVGDRAYDLSVRSQLKKFHRSVMSV